MTAVEPGAGTSGLVARVKNILMSPNTEWDRIDVEPATVKSLYTGYICILAAIPAICMAIGHMMPMGAFGVYFRYSPVGAIVSGIVYYVGQLVGAYITALIIDALAPSFGGQKNQVQALKVAAYSWTAAWLAGVFYILPQLSMLAIVGLYSLYLLYLGLPRLMKAPQDKALGYTIVSVIVAAVVTAIIMTVVGMFTMTSMFAAASPAIVVN